MREVREELSIHVDQEDLDLYKSLNMEQRAGFDEIIHHVLNNKSQVFFVDGPGGTGKHSYTRQFLPECARTD